MKNERLEIDGGGLTQKEIREAIQEARQKKSGITLEQAEMSLKEIRDETHELIFEFYPERIRQACKYPKCDLECYFRDKKELCPTFASKVEYEII